MAEAKSTDTDKMAIKAEDIVDKEIMVGLGRSFQRVVVITREGGGATFFSGRNRIEQEDAEKIERRILPDYAVCASCNIKPKEAYLELKSGGMLSMHYDGNGMLFLNLSMHNWRAR